MDSPPNALSPGTALGPYEIVSLLGAGGMGEVYRARDPRLEREIAIKVLPEALASDPDRLRRFRDEALTASRLNHPNIVQVFDIGEQDGLRYVALELIEGQTFETLLGDGGLPWERLEPLARQVLEGLAAAHESGIVHRDLKPANLMVTDKGYVKILDFGLAKQFELDEDLTSKGTLAGSPTTPGTTLGTLGYMSPEQAKGVAADHRSDQFSFGVVLYELATGERPFGRETPAESIAALLTANPEPLESSDVDLPAVVCAAVMRCLSKSPEERYDQTGALLEALSRRASDSQRPSLASPSPEATASDHRTPLAGRDEELAQLLAHLERANQGKGGLVTLVGEPGVGKTRLTEELCQEARSRGVFTLVGHCYEGEGAPPYVPWIEILERAGQLSERETLREFLGHGASEIARIYPELRQLLPELSAPLEMPAEQARAYLFRCFREFLERAARRRPLLLVLEDLHWADDATLLLLEHLAPHLGEVPLLVLGTYRDVDLEVSRPMAKTLQQLVRQRLVERISLQRLSQENVASMIEGLAKKPAPEELVARIHHETEGNPFFVEEVYLHLEEEGRLFDESGGWRVDFSAEELDVPEGVRLVVGRRLERLDEEERAALQAAAVIGRRFSFELLSALQESLGRGDEDALLDAVEKSEQLALIEPTPNSKHQRETGYRFTHELIRQTLLSALSLPRRQRLHLRVAEAIEASADASQYVSAMAHHLHQSGAAADLDKTIRFLDLAGQQALESGAFEDALRHFDDALELVEIDRSELRANLLRRRGEARQSLGRWDDAIQDWNEALKLFTAQSNHGAACEIALGTVMIHIWQTRFSENLPLLESVLEKCPEEATAERSRLLGCYGATLSETGDWEEGDRTTQQAVAMAEELGDRHCQANAYLYRSTHFWHSMRRSETADLCARAAELAEETGDLWLQLEAAAIHSWAVLLAGRGEDSSRWGFSIEEAAERLGHLTALLHIRFANVVRDLLGCHDVRQVEAAVQQLLELEAHTETPYLSMAEAWHGLASFLRGDWQEARDRVAGRERLWHAPEGGVLWGSEFLCECYLGNEAAARELLTQVRDRIPTEDRVMGVGQWEILFAMIEGLTMLGAKDEVAELYPLALAATRTGAVVTHLGRHLLETLAGIAAASGRRWEEAERHFETARRQAEGLPFRTERAEGRRFNAAMLIDRAGSGDTERAKALLGEAIALYREAGMPRHVELAEELRGA